jgi:hypothetical protein
MTSKEAKKFGIFDKFVRSKVRKSVVDKVEKIVLNEA